MYLYAWLWLKSWLGDQCHPEFSIYIFIYVLISTSTEIFQNECTNQLFDKCWRIAPIHCIWRSITLSGRVHSLCSWLSDTLIPRFEKLSIICCVQRIGLLKFSWFACQQNTYVYSSAPGYFRVSNDDMMSWLAMAFCWQTVVSITEAAVLVHLSGKKMEWLCVRRDVVTSLIAVTWCLTSIVVFAQSLSPIIHHIPRNTI